LQLGIGLLGQQILPELVQPQGFGALEEAGEVGFGEHKLELKGARTLSRMVKTMAKGIDKKFI
jgi:inhibitor of KinA sporulation pathway (predicted exonuclease)